MQVCHKLLSHVRLCTLLSQFVPNLTIFRIYRIFYAAKENRALCVSRAEIADILLGHVPLCTLHSQNSLFLTINNKYRIFHKKCALWAISAGLSQIAKSCTSMYTPVAICSEPYY